MSSERFGRGLAASPALIVSTVLLLCACSDGSPGSCCDGRAGDAALDRGSALDLRLSDLPAPGPDAPRWSLSRQRASDLRLVSYNVYFDAPFTSGSTAEARLKRLVRALDADVWALQEVWKTDPTVVGARFDAWAPLPGGQRWSVRKAGDTVTVSRFPVTLHHTAPGSGSGRQVSLALIDLPDGTFARDLYLLNNHFPCCGGAQNDALRQAEADRVVAWLRDARTAGGAIDLPAGTLLVVAGDLNLVGSTAPLTTLLSGDISDETSHGADSPPDWDGSALFDAHPRHNGSGSADYTWRDDGGIYQPGRLDFVLYSDSVASVGRTFVLNTMTLPAAELAAAGLQAEDVTLKPATGGTNYDHLPVVVDFVVAPTQP